MNLYDDLHLKNFFFSDLQFRLNDVLCHLIPVPLVFVLGAALADAESTVGS